MKTVVEFHSASGVFIRISHPTQFLQQYVLQDIRKFFDYIHIDARVLQFGEVTQIVPCKYPNNWFLFSGIPQNVGMMIF